LNLNRTKKLALLFYALIIASTLLSFSGCGFKADPFYDKKEQK